jgi:hypothetical protein
MATLSLSVAGDLANALLTFYVRGDALSQTTQDKPLLRVLTAGAETFPGGKDAVSSPVQIAFMSDTAGFFQGYSEDDELLFKQAANTLRASYDWKEHHSGLIITWTELKKDGISVVDNNQVKEHSKRDLFVLTKVLKNRLDDFGESWARSKQTVLWRDGTQATKVVAGLTSLLLTSTVATATTGGLSRATYVGWRNRTALNIAPSAQNQTLTKTIRREMRQLRRYSGRPNVALAGEEFLNALELEIEGKGDYTTTGFTKKTDVSMGDIAYRGITFEYDPTLDDLGLSKYCYIFDDRRVRLRPMEGEANVMHDPNRPYNHAVFTRSMMATCALEATQLNACDVISIA